MDIPEEVKKWVIDQWMKGALNFLSKSLVDDPELQESTKCIKVNYDGNHDFEGTILITVKRKGEKDDSKRTRSKRS